ncbi:hypothetical protein U9M48_000778 [Paspalum notatum var. saurae]|uniref:Uncharacterized protein n=1 Tax=Paspalum notatum var. saurae TaxID=547442 RepID=A0AAQ3SID1_PASNO
MIQVPRGLSKGIQLDSITRGLGEKISIHIAEAAKFASEGGITIRQHVPIFTHWKFYKNKKNKEHVQNYLDKLSTQFNIDTCNPVVENACLDMLKSGQRQMRYRLKKQYFNGVPASAVRIKSPVKCMIDDQWRELVKEWSTSDHKEKCIKNKSNRGEVQLQQRTGSRCYISHAYVAAAMETIVSESGQEGQQPMSPTEVVSQVLPKSSTFLQNVGIKFGNKSRNGGASALQMQQLQAQLDAEKQESAGLKDQLDTIKLQAQESEAKLSEQTLEIDILNKKQEETNALLRQLLSFSHGQSNTP